MRKYEFTGEIKTVDLWSRVATLAEIRGCSGIRQKLAAIEQAFGGTEKLKAAVDKKCDAEQKMFKKILEVLFE